MEHYYDILRLLAILSQVVPEHPVAAMLLAGAWTVLVYLGSKVADAAVSHFWTEHVLKRRFPSPPPPTEDALRGQVERLSRELGRAEAERDAAREDEQRAREDARAERRRAQRIEDALRDAPPRRIPRPRKRRGRRR
ncbi:hypothetical protein GBA65_07205 [Rubrobacter marinus]|uniref:Uncharacterized protein n=1 Tax=Rubrobacter marinus TaxID=2653852 RepID=A0A6G8PVV0_9ACTN|nr:hypothetical protein [Rubrobacter marinus]QIN78341.1 hypothetical protein GBA65_07205 [Rubrobacter marinus]